MPAVKEMSPATELKQIKEKSDGTLIDFNEGDLRNTLIQAAGNQLSMVTATSAHSIEQQIKAIRSSSTEFEDILERVTTVRDNVCQIDTSMCKVVEEAQGSSQELQQVTGRMQVLEEHFASINGLVKMVNDIADQTNLLALNATIEAARAGEAGKGFAVVANEVKELSGTTKKANQEIQDTLSQIGKAITDLSHSVGQSEEKMNRSIEAVDVAKENASKVQVDISHFGTKLQATLLQFSELDRSSVGVENNVREMNTIGKTFTYLLEMMVMQGVFGNTLDPLERLTPVVEGSTFSAPRRFAASEKEYVLKPNDILISATDTRGVITFANNCFYEIAEYEPGELVGQPHNIIRHPDMPKTAFADLWAVIQSGKLWQGYVANHSRNKRLYWVKATAFPCFENGKIVGYLSIRTKPDREKIQQAAGAYRLVP